jgi:hypothetical protein
MAVITDGVSLWKGRLPDVTPRLRRRVSAMYLPCRILRVAGFSAPIRRTAAILKPTFVDGKL